MKRRLFSARLLTAVICLVLIAVSIPVFASAADLKAPKMKSISNVETGVKTTWEKVTGAAEYRVFRKTDEKDASWKAIGQTKKTSFIDKKTSSGKTYIYAVRAVDKKGKVKSDFSNSLKITYYATPNMTGADIRVEGVLVSWSSSGSAPLYRLYRKQGSGDWKEIGTTKTTQYLDTTVKLNRTYTYRAQVVTADNKTTLSAVDSTPITVTYTRPVEIKSLTNKAKSIRVTWSKLNVASKYRLFRRLGAGDWFEIATTTKTVFSDKDVKNNLTYTYYVRALDANGSYIGAYDPNGKSITYFVAPKMNECVRSNGALLITWEEVEGISNYAIFRRIGGGEWIRVGTSPTSSFSDTTMPSGTWCEYTVACADAMGVVCSAYGQRVVGATSYLNSPKLESIVNGVNSTTVSWKPVDKAEKYVVYRKIGDDMPQWVEIGTTADTTFTDTKVSHAKRYTYTVAVREAAGVPDPGEDMSTYDEQGISITYYNPPVLNSLTNNTDGATIAWGKVDGVPNYNIWRQTGNEGWTVIGTVHGASVGYVFTDTSVVNNGHYWYSVSCVADSESAYSTPGLETTFYAAPVVSDIVIGDGQTTISWGAVESITDYRVERKVITPTQEKDWVVVSKSQTARTYTDTKVKSGNRYMYRVRSQINKTGVSGYRTVGPKTYLAAPVSVSAKTGLKKGEVIVEWEISGVGATSHEIYAQLKRSGDWQLVGTTGKVDTTFTVTGLTSGTEYQFKVVAVCSDSRSVDSNISTAKAR